MLSPLFWISLTHRVQHLFFEAGMRGDMESVKVQGVVFSYQTGVDMQLLCTSYTTAL